MRSYAGLLAAAALLAAALAVAGLPDAAATLPPTACVSVDETTVTGLVTNPGPDVLRVEGMVRFVFIAANTMSRPTIQVPSAVLIPPGRTMNVALARVGSSLLPSESCRLDVSGAVR